MAPPQRASRPAGFRIGDVWGLCLDAKRDTATGAAVEYLLKNGGPRGGHMTERLMVKFEEIEEYL